jgi:hypothetical protein
MGLSYRRGLTRVYVVLAAVWIVWAAYKPMLHREKGMNGAIKRANKINQQCQETSANSIRRIAELSRRGEDASRDPECRMMTVDLPYCYERREIAMKRF